MDNTVSTIESVLEIALQCEVDTIVATCTLISVAHSSIIRAAPKNILFILKILIMSWL